jgi:hypothetical protein
MAEEPTAPAVRRVAVPQEELDLHNQLRKELYQLEPVTEFTRYLSKHEGTFELGEQVICYVE